MTAAAPVAFCGRHDASSAHCGGVLDYRSGIPRFLYKLSVTRTQIPAEQETCREVVLIDIREDVPYILSNTGLVRVLDLGLNEQASVLFRTSSSSVRADIERLSAGLVAVGRFR